MVSKKFFYALLILGIFLLGGFWLVSKFWGDDLIPRTVLFSNPQKEHVHISPDGTRLAYLAPHSGRLTIWVRTIGKNDDHPIIKNVRRSIRKFVWAKNNKNILFVQDKDGDENWHVYRIDLESFETSDLTPFAGVRAKLHSLSSHAPNKVLITMNKRDKDLFDVYLLDVTSGDLKLVAENPGDVDVWLADSQLKVRATVAIKSDGSTELLIRDNEQDEWKSNLKWGLEDSLVGSVPPKGSRPVRFSKDGNSLYLIDSLDSDTQRLIKMNLKTGQREVLASDEQYDIAFVLFDNKTGEPDLFSFVRERRVWKALNPSTEKDLNIVLSAHDGDLLSIDRNLDGTKWIAQFVNDNGPSAFYLYDRQTKKAEFLFYDKPDLKKYKLAQTKTISFTSRDGLTINGYLTCPREKKQKDFPLVLYVHPGPWHRDTWGYTSPAMHNATAQFLANRGYACLQINFRGSRGYGKKFLNAGDKEWAGAMHDDLIDGVQWAIKQGIANPKKVAIFGASYGGYAALVGATFTPDVFRCAVAMSAPTNLITLLDSIISFRPAGRAKWYRRLGNPKTDQEFLKSRSPLFKADQIKIPVFIAQGGNDPRVKQSEADQTVAALKANNVEHVYMLFPKEGHSITHPINRFKLAVAVEKFLAKHLGGKFEKISLTIKLKFFWRLVKRKVSSWFGG